MSDDEQELTHDDRVKLERILMDFDQQWSVDSLSSFAAKLNYESRSFSHVAIVELIKIDLSHHWSMGNPQRIEPYTPLISQFTNFETITADLILSEYMARQDAGETCSEKEYRERFPDQFDEFKELIRAETTRRSANRIDASVSTDGSDSLQDTLDHRHVAADNRPSGKNQRSLSGDFGRYRIIRRLGAGAMGDVFLAHDTQLDRQVALKTPNFQGDANHQLIERFYREARAAGNLRHPNVCPVFDVGETDGRHYLTMAFIEGKPLSSLINENRTLDQKIAAQIVHRIALGLSHAHGAGIIHRDLKPANVMMDAEGQPIVMDFGLAHRKDEAQSRMTQSGTILGTPAYMSPEQVRGEIDEVGPLSDIYSLGIMLYELLTGQLPFSGPVASVIAQILTQEPATPSELRGDVDPALESICMRMIAKDASQRYQSMEKVACALDAFINDPMVETTDLPQAARAGRSAKSPNADSETTASDEQDRRPDKSTPSFWRSQSALMSMVGASALLVATIAFSILIRTKYGDLKITTNDPAIEVKVEGRRIEIVDTSTTKRMKVGKYSFSLNIGDQRLPLDKLGPFKIAGRDGEYQLELDYQGFQLQNDRFEIHQGQVAVLDIQLRPAVDRTDSLPTTDVSVGVAKPCALMFDGIDDQIRIANFNYDGKSPLTVEAVVEVDQEHRSTVFSTWSPGYVMLDYDGREWRFWNSSALAGRGVAAQTPLASGPTHVAGVWDGRQCTLFVNGKRQKTQPLALRMGPQRGANATAVGANHDGQALLKGVLHELRVSGTARYDADFTASNELSSDDDTLFHYRIDAGKGSLLADTSGNGHDGHISGATWTSLAPNNSAEQNSGRYEGIAVGAWIPILDISPPSRHEKIQYRNGVLRMTDIHLVKPDFIGRDMIMRARMKKISGQNVNFKLRSRDSGNTYSFWLNSLGLMGIGKTIGGKHTNLEKASPKGIEVDDEGFVEVAFAAIGDRLRVFVNDRKIFDLRDSSLPDGYPSLKAIGVSEFKDVELMFLDEHSPTDVLISDRWHWSKPQLFGSPVDLDDSDVAGMQLVRGVAVFNFSSNRIGGEGGYDLYGGWVKEDVEDVKKIESWGRGINSQSDELAIATVAGLKHVIFQRSQPGSVHSADLWMGRRKSASIELFEDCEPLPAPMNSGGFDGMPTLSANSMTMIYASDRRGGKGGSDLWIATWPSHDGPFAQPRNLGLPINTDQHEAWPCLSADGRALIFQRFSGKFETIADSTNAEDGQLWIATRSATSNPFERPMKMDAQINNGDPVSCTALSTDGRTLFFKRGGRIWVSHRISNMESGN